MPNFTGQLPLSLYIHIPWCVRKCPYCDFNSHAAKGSLPEELYVSALIDELSTRLSLVQHRPIMSIFFGGGTPSLFSPSAIEQILNGVAKQMTMSPAIEITLEANPGTIDEARFQGFHAAGVNRLSLGVQSLQDAKLKSLGRIHDREHAICAIHAAKEAGFTNFNLDLMFGLPQQSIDDALQDLETALNLEPTHLSWYQLTIEPNTLFYHQKPILPVDDIIWEMQMAGQKLIQQNGFCQYEVSAYSLPDKECRHNLNYWEFGDYLGIGAGAHSKITQQDHSVIRFSQVRNPKDYLDASQRRQLNKNIVSENDLIFEFMLNAMRLTDGVPVSLFHERTGISLAKIASILDKAKQRGLLVNNPVNIIPSETGKKFLNNLITMFLPD